MVRCEVSFAEGRFIGFVKKQSAFTKKELDEFGSKVNKLNECLEHLYTGAITLEDVPADWREEIQRRVDERIQREREMENQDLSAEETLAILLGGEQA